MLCEKDLQIKNKLGLHARAAAQFVKIANRFSSEVMVEKGRLKVNGKSILGVLTLAAACGSTIRIRCDGPDADETLHALETLIEAKFAEE
jgi:phosphocarrier protein